MLVSILATRPVYVYKNLRYPRMLKWLPYNNHIRAVAFLNSESIYYPDAWGLFYILLGGIYRLADLTGLHNFHINFFLLFQTTFLNLSIYLFFLISKRLFSFSAAFLSTIVLALYYPLLYINTLILSESIFTSLLIVLFYLVVMDNNKYLNKIAQAVVVALLIVCKPMFISFIPFMLVWNFVQQHDLKERLRGKIAISLGQLLTVFLILFLGALINRGVDTKGRYAVASNGGVNLAITQCKLGKLSYKLGNRENFWFSPPVYSKDGNYEEASTSVPFFNQGYYVRMGLSCIAKSPQNFLGGFSNIYRIYDSVLYPKLSAPPWHETQLLIWKTIAMLLTIFFFIYPFSHSKEERRYYWFALALIMSLYLSIFLANPGEERYLIPYFFLLVLFGVPSIIRFITADSQKFF